LGFLAQIILSSSVDIIDRRKSEISVFLAYGFTKAEIIIQFILEMAFFVATVLLVGGLFCLISLGIINQAHFYAFNLPIEFIFSSVDLQVKMNPLLFLIVSLLFLLIYGICFFTLLYVRLGKDNLLRIMAYAR
jgi:ABC-type antimicrobial peptide transport system permease subunit